MYLVFNWGQPKDIFFNCSIIVCRCAVLGSLPSLVKFIEAKLEVLYLMIIFVSLKYIKYINF